MIHPLRSLLRLRCAHCGTILEVMKSGTTKLICIKCGKSQFEEIKTEVITK